jgi:DNA-damage-inducible protein D
MADDPGGDPQARFDSIRQVNPYGQEYWSARELAPLLGYKSWDRVPELIDRAKAVCQNTGQVAEDHIRGASKMIAIGKGAHREVPDYLLSRFGCYLVAMNGDPRKPEIAAAQAYFAVQTRRAERWDEMREALAERVHLRQELAEANKRLNAVAQAAGVNSRSFGRLHDAGYRGLYGGMGAQDIKAHKGIPPQDDLPDRMGAAELAANWFVRTQTEQKVTNEHVQGGAAVIGAHFEVGAETRALIDRLGGTRPEELPAEPSIRPLLDQQSRRRQLVPDPAQPTLLDAPGDDE